MELLLSVKLTDDDAANEAFLNFAMDLEKRVVNEDVSDHADHSLQTGDVDKK